MAPVGIFKVAGVLPWIYRQRNFCAVRIGGNGNCTNAIGRGRRAGLMLGRVTVRSEPIESRSVGRMGGPSDIR